MKRPGISAGILAIIVGVVVAVLSIAIAIGVYHVGYASVSAMGTVTGSANIVGTNTLSITLTASGGMAKVYALNIYDASGNLLVQVRPGSVAGSGACSGASFSIQVYNATSGSTPYTTWGSQVIQAGQSMTVNIQSSTTCLGSAAEVQVVYNNGRSITLTVGS